MNTSRRYAPIALFLCPLLLLNTGCEMLMNNKESIGGAALLGTIGAVAGTLACKDNKAVCAAVGGGTGVVLGAAIGHYVAKQERSRTETTAAVGYRPDQGNLLTITEETVAPTVVKPGNPVTLNVKYTILRPEEDKATMRETREVRRNDGAIIHSETINRDFDQGEQRISWEYPVKSDAQFGTYQMITTAVVEDKQASKIVTFVVK